MYREWNVSKDAFGTPMVIESSRRAARSGSDGVASGIENATVMWMDCVSSAGRRTEGADCALKLFTSVRIIAFVSSHMTRAYSVRNFSAVLTGKY